MRMMDLLLYRYPYLILYGALLTVCMGERCFSSTPHQEVLVVSVLSMFDVATLEYPKNHIIGQAV